MSEEPISPCDGFGRFEDKVHAKAYQVAERAGLIWVYMGPRAEAPPMPAIEATLLDSADVDLMFVQRECNWLQALEGDIDTSHLDFLHFGAEGERDFNPTDPPRFGQTHRDPEYKVADTAITTAKLAEGCACSACASAL